MSAAHAQTLSEPAPAEPSVPKDQRIHLSWVRAASALECGDAAHVQQDVVRRLGKDPFGEPSTLFVEAQVTREAERFVASLELRDVAGTSLGSRQVASDAPTCASLVSAAGLAIALMIDPDAVAEPKLAPKPKPLPQEPAPPPPPQVQTITVREPARTWLLVGAAGAIRTLPRASVGVVLGGGLDLSRHVALELTLSFHPEQRERLRGFDVSFGLSRVSLAPCLALVRGRSADLWGCAIGRVGAVHAVTHAPERSADSQLPWAAAGVGLRAGWLLSPPVALRMGISGDVPLLRRDYKVSVGEPQAQEVVVFSEPRFAATLDLGLALRW